MVLNKNPFFLMCTRFLAVSAMVCLLGGIDPLTAQSLRPARTWFVAPQLGISSYLGDNEQSPFNFNWDAYRIPGKFPYMTGIEVGYQLRAALGVGLSWRIADYPVITQFEDEVDRLEDAPTTRHTVRLLSRYTFGAKAYWLAPYLQAGPGLSFGNTEIYQPLLEPQSTFQQENRLAGGLHAGFGVDMFVNYQTSVVLEVGTDLLWRDESIDGREDDKRFWSADLLTSFGIGIKFSRNSSVADRPTTWK